jgi:homocysteine S-methyltransferase
MDFLEALHARVVPGDGAMGTLLLARGVSRGACLEELCVSRPELIGEIHREYLEAGAKVIRTHSFGANSARLTKHGLERRVGELNWVASRIAREATKGTSAIVAASVGPTGQCEGSRAILEEQMGALLDGGAQMVILETFTDLRELLLAVEVKHTLHHCPVVASMACGSATEVADAFRELKAAGTDVVGLNCLGDPSQVMEVLPSPDEELAYSAFPNAGLPRDEDGTLVYPVEPDAFAEGMAALAKRGVRFLGGCCGTTPEHIAAMTLRLGLREPAPVR